MRHATQEGIDLIKNFEGFRPTLYTCPGGKPTIGYGHVVKKHEGFTKISKDEAENLLRRDVEAAEHAVTRLVDVPLTDGQYSALVSFVFNLGSGAFQASTLRRKINCRLHSEAPKQLKRWVWAGGKKLRGLERRRAAESKLYESSGEVEVEQKVAKSVPVTPKPKKTVTLYPAEIIALSGNVLIETEMQVDDYLNPLREKLLAVVKAGDMVRLIFANAHSA